MKFMIDQANAIVWSPVLVFLCLVAGIFFSVKTRFVQVRYLPHMLALLKSGDRSGHGISSLQALTMSLSGRVGTGNIAGVAAAIGFGGPGAVFWMWVIAFLGAATAFIESTLGQIYKEEWRGEYRGGPAFYIEKALSKRSFACVFAVVTVIATGLLLPGVQANSVASAITQATVNYPEVYATLSAGAWGVGFILSLIVAVIIFGGVKRIARFTQVVVPMMALFYLVLALIIIGMHIELLPSIFKLIIADALTPMAGLGAAVGWGVKRGIYSNEAGQGTGPHAAAAAEVDHPVQQGIVQAFSVYIDTLIVCTATALIILIAGTYNVHAEGAGFFIQNIGSDIVASSPAYTQLAIEKHFPGLGALFVAVALSCFAFTTIIAYYYIAETNLVYLMRYTDRPWLFWVLKAVFISVIFYGCVKTADLAWGLGDLGVGLMAWVNIIAIFCIFYKSCPALKALKDYESQLSQKVEKLSFSPRSLGIDNAHYWELRSGEVEESAQKH